MRRGSPAWMLLLALAGLSLALSACGSNESNSSTALTKSEFLKKGNAICKQGNEEINEAGKEQFPRSGGKPSQAELEEFASKTVVPNIQSQINRIRALPAPEGEEETVEAIVNAAQKGLDQAKNEPSVLIGKGPDPFEEANKLAKGFGLNVCGSE